MANPVLVIGWDAADWQLINPLLDQGSMPHLARLVEGGCIANLATLYPCLSPLLWTSVATGKTADQHGILSFLEPTQSGLGAQLARSTSRRVKAIWNIAQEAGRRSVVANWYASHPAERFPGICISNEAFKAPPGEASQEWPLVKGSVHPASLAGFLAELRIHPAEIAPEDLVPLIPRIREVDLQADRRPRLLAEILARNLSVQSLFTASLEQAEWDFAAVFFDAIDTAGHLFMPYHPPQLPAVTDRDFEVYQHVMTGLYKLHDQMLGRLLELAGPETHVVLLSDHGFLTGEGRPQTISQADSPEAEAAEWHRQYGVLVLHGPMIRRDERLYGATLLDVAPTILTLLGLPAGEDMPGKVLAQALATDLIPKRIPTWETAPGSASKQATATDVPPVSAAAEIAQLVKLGYLPSTAVADANLAQTVIREQQYNLAAVHLHHGRPAEARPILERLCDRYPDQPRFLEPLATCWQHLQRPEKCLELLERMQDLDFFSVKTYLLAANCFGQLGDHTQAVTAFQLAEELAPHSALVPLLRGEYLITQGRNAEAEAQLSLAVQRDPESPRGWESLARAYLIHEKPAEAETAARTAISRRYFSPLGHYCLGLALAKQGRYQPAVRAIQTAVEQYPGLKEAHVQLAQLYQKLGNPILASHHLEIVSQSAERKPGAPPLPENRPVATPTEITAGVAPAGEPVIVVSGLPRSGTSLVMQLIAAAGCELLIDDARAADASNPQGYFEYAPVLNLTLDSTWVESARGKAVKVLYPLVLDLPQGPKYRVIVVQRDLDEILDSQAAMLEHNQELSEDRAELRSAWESMAARAWESLRARGDCDVLTVEHRDIVARDNAAVARLLEFLGSPVSPDQLLKVIRPELYRSRR